MNKSGGQTLTSGSSSTSGQGSDDASLKPKLPAWEILEAVPFVVDAALTAWPKELADYLPASLATILGYFSAEATHAIWEPAAAYLSTVEDLIKKILATTGVDVPRGQSTLPFLKLLFMSIKSNGLCQMGF
ncbi:Mediator of rna polymerase ii transcription subunit 33a [Thalictrum thalictroides]|uniref:Mediator of rna polymerase ii transcription subunit 33a n=1 Tax=Thalictrum thalictroides TaxID=46969 RepID=A0A7J6VZQ1_THATH|nr:Mediator of rna polymerase ii transcription subunit 33a [Thalictrum thalictroides]